jgi:tetratricopeptide (TPR) repeat protein
MKKTAILLALFMLIGIISTAQDAKVVSAYNYLNKGKLDKAKENIDAATIYDKTMGDPKTWLYCGNVYINIYSSLIPAYKNLDTNALDKATEAYIKCIELDKKGSYKESAVLGLETCSDQIFDKAAVAYNKQDYPTAIKYFEKCIDIKNKAGKFDVIATYYAAKSFELHALDTNNKSKEKFDIAYKHYSKLIENKFQDTVLAPQVYISMSEILMYKKDTAKALSTIQEARKNNLFKNNFNLMIQEANIYLKTNNKVEADKIIDQAFKKDPNNPNLRFYVGTNYFNMLEKMVYDKDTVSFKNTFSQAESNLVKAIELNPKLYDAIYNLAVLYLNEGIRIYDAAQKLDPIKEASKYDIENAKTQAFFKKSIVQFEKYYDANPTDLQVMTNLKVLYIKTNQLDSPKYKEILEKLKK